MLIATRGRLMGSLPAGGRMAAVFADEATVRSFIQDYADTVSIAAVNGPENVVISGTGEAVEAIVEALGTQGIKARALNVSHAFHSPLMQPMLRDFENAASTVRYEKPRIKLVSNVTGQIAGSDVQTAQYWVNHIRASVRFSDSVATLAEMGSTVFLEIGPGSTLLGMGQRCLPEAGDSLLWLSSLRKGQSDWQQMLSSLGELYVHQAPVDWNRFDEGYAHQRIALPSYPFQRERHWIALPKTSNHKRQTDQTGLHPLLGKAIRSPMVKEILFETAVSTDTPAFVTDHRIYGSVVFPATGYLEMALAAGITLRKGAQTVRNLTIQEAFILPDDKERTLQLVLTPHNGSDTEFKILSVEDADASVWKLHATGHIANQPTIVNSAVSSLSELQSQPRETVSVEEYYQQLLEGGLNYGKTFQCIVGLWVNKASRNVLGQLHIGAAEAKGYNLFPGLIDACFQLLGAMLTTDDNVYLPIMIEEFSFDGHAATDLWAYASIRDNDLQRETLVCDLSFFDVDGNVVAELNGLRLKRANRQTLERLMQPSFDELLYEITWQQKSLASTTTAAGDWLILADNAGMGAQVASDLQAQGANRCDVVFASEPLTRPETYHELLTAAAYRGVIYLWALDTEKPNSQIDSSAYLNVLHLTQALAKLGDNAPRLSIVTRNVHAIAPTDNSVSVEQSALWGLGRVISLEHPEFWQGLIDLSDNTLSNTLTRAVLQQDGETQIAIRGDQTYAARLVHSHKKHDALAGTAVELVNANPGILDNLTLQPLVRRSPGNNEIEVAVMASGLNFRDVLNALGMYPGVAPLGNECAGVVVGLGEGVTDFSIGDEVIALGSGTFKSFVTTTADQVFHKPARLSFAQAVSVPTTFLTAAFGLHHLAQVQAGQRVLIHSAAGGVGLAAVQLMQRAGAEIFATAGSPEKRAFLKSIGVQHVMNSRTLDFAEEVMTLTNGAGVDVVLNSLADDFIPKSLSVVAQGGVFLEIGKRGVWESEQVAASFPTITYYVYDLVVELNNDPALVWSLLHQLLADFESGSLKPLPTQEFPIQKAIDAFRHMAQAKHMGKVVITHDLHKKTRSVIRDDATYLITGGLGGLGLQAANWMVEQGARHIVLVGRSAASDDAQERIAKWASEGAQVIAAQADVNYSEQIADILGNIRETMPPLRGIIHAAGIVNDGLLVNQNDAQFKQVLAPKVQGAWHLHSLTQDIPLDFFVMFSAGAALLGSSGQGNYAAANAFLDGLAHYRRAQGLTALSINWGAWADVGMAAALGEQQQQRLSSQGIGTIVPSQGVKVLQQLIEQDSIQTAVLPINWAKLGQQFASGIVPPFLSEVAQVGTTPSTATSKEAAEPTLLKQLEASVASERRELLVGAIREQVERVLGLSPAHSIGLRQGLTEMGMDSLMAVELSNRLKGLLGQPLPATLAFEHPTINALADYIEQHVLSSSMKPEVSTPTKPDAEEAILSELEALSDDEIESSVLDELKKAGY